MGRTMDARRKVPNNRTCAYKGGNGSNFCYVDAYGTK